MDNNELLISAVNEQRNSLTTDRLDMSYGEIMSMYEKDEIIISPAFQRLYRWNFEQRTRFIESILLGIPIPPIFVAEDKNGIWELVDGLQRISTIISFFGILKNDQNNDNNWVLDEGALVTELDGFSSNDLPSKLVRSIKRTYCRVEIIKWDSDYDMRYELFNRLNTGGEPLTSQEIRNCIYRGISEDFNNFLSKLAKDVKYQSLISIGESKKGQLFDEELILRFIAIYDSDISQMKSKNASELMDEYMRKSVEEENYYYSDIESIFNRVVNLLSGLPYSIFRFENGQFSTSLYDAIMVGVAKNIDEYEKMGIQKLQKVVEGIKEEENFSKHVGAAASSRSRLINRTKAALTYFKEKSSELEE